MEILEFVFDSNASNRKRCTHPKGYFTTEIWKIKAFYGLVCKVVNLWDIDLKILGLISDFNIDNCAKFVKSTYLEHEFERFWTFQTYNFQTRWFMSQILVDFVPSHRAWRPEKFHGHAPYSLECGTTPLP